MQAVRAHHALFSMARVGKLGHIGLVTPGEKGEETSLVKIKVSPGDPALVPPALFSSPHRAGWQQPCGSFIYPLCLAVLVS